MDHKNTTNIDSGINERNLEVTFEKEDIIELPNISILIKERDKKTITFFFAGYIFNTQSLLDVSLINGIYKYKVNRVDPSFYSFTNSSFIVQKDKFEISSDNPTGIALGISFESFILVGLDFEIEVTIGDLSMDIKTSEGVSLGISKEIKIDRYGNETIKYNMKPTFTYSPDLKLLDASSLQIFFYLTTNLVRIEREQSNLDVAINIISNIGSVVSTVVMVVTLVFHRGITRLLIQDKSGWFDTEIRQTIIYHADKLNKSNIVSNELKTIDIKE